ncbi:hypothetical protein Syun_029414 [Stephania yunnanensis]|uniref:Uncharacterized protein n=1 Tax=Stephania yunnanensis TaxID=152371 RepID=A0AAP0E7Y0_9MAGN
MVTCNSSILDLRPGPSSSHYTSSSPPGHPYSYQHGTPSPPVHALLAQHGIVPSSSHHFTPSPPADGHPHDHGFRSSSSHHATPSPSVHPAHSPGVGEEHTSTSRKPPAPHRHSSMRSSSNRLRSSIPNAIEEIPDFFRPPTAPTESENPLIYLIAEPVLLHPSSLAVGKMSFVFKSGYLKKGWKWGNMFHNPNEIYTGLDGRSVFFTWDLQMSFAIYDVWCRKAAIQYTGNIYLIVKKSIAPIYLTYEVFEHYKRMRATDETFKKKSERMSTNRNSEAEVPRRLEDMSTQSPDTSIDEDAIYLEMVPEVKGRVYGLGSQGYHQSISLEEASSSRGPVYGLHKLEELQRDR